MAIFGGEMATAKIQTVKGGELLSAKKSVILKSKGQMRERHHAFKNPIHSRFFHWKEGRTDIPRVIRIEDFMAQYPFSQFAVEPVNTIPTGVYELTRWWSSTAVAVLCALGDELWLLKKGK